MIVTEVQRALNALTRQNLHSAIVRLTASLDHLSCLLFVHPDVYRLAEAAGEMSSIYGWPRLSIGGELAAGMLASIGVRHPDQREGVVETLRLMLPELDDDGQLILSSKEREEPPELWTWVVYALMGMRDTTTQPLVLALFEADVIDMGIFGGRQDYLAAFKPNARLVIDAGKTYDILEIYQGYYDEAQAEERERALAARRQVEEEQRGVRARPAGKAVKVGRNDPCPCGSGKKYKKCCGQRQ